MLTAHEKKQITYLRSRMTFYPAINKFHTTQLVIWRGAPAFVEEHDNSNEHPTEFVYTLTFGSGHHTDHDDPVPERDIRAIKLSEFLWYLDPQTGERKIGNNLAWPWYYGTALALLATIFGGPLGGGAWLYVTIAVMWSGSWLIPFGAWMQYRSRWH